jgi:hypothetical protein
MLALYAKTKQENVPDQKLSAISGRKYSTGCARSGPEAAGTPGLTQNQFAALLGARQARAKWAAKTLIRVAELRPARSDKHLFVLRRGIHRRFLAPQRRHRGRNSRRYAVHFANRAHDRALYRYAHLLHLMYGAVHRAVDLI